MTRIVVWIIASVVLLTAGFWIEMVRKGEPRRPDEPFLPPLGLFALVFVIPYLWVLAPGIRLFLILSPVAFIFLAPRIKTDWIRVPTIAFTIVLELGGLAVSALHPFVFLGTGESGAKLSPDGRYEATVMGDLDRAWIALRPRRIDFGNVLDWPASEINQPRCDYVELVSWEDRETLVVGCAGQPRQTRLWNGIQIRFEPFPPAARGDR